MVPTPVVPVAFNVPVCEHVPWLVLLNAGNFDLLETPLRQIHISCSEVAPKVYVS